MPPIFNTEDWVELESWVHNSGRQPQQSLLDASQCGGRLVDVTNARSVVPADADQDRTDRRSQVDLGSDICRL